MTQRLGAELARHGYRRFFDVDYLLDVDTGDLYLGRGRALCWSAPAATLFG